MSTHATSTNCFNHTHTLVPPKILKYTNQELFEINSKIIEKKLKSYNHNIIRKYIESYNKDCMILQNQKHQIGKNKKNLKTKT